MDIQNEALIAELMKQSVIQLKPVIEIFFNKGMEIGKSQAVPEWISVEDKLPAENGNYLVCIDGDVFYLTAKWVKNHFKFLARGYGLTEDFTDWRYCEGVKVTHWMTLPAAPQEPTND